VLIGAFSKYKLVGALAIPGAILAAAYMLRLFQKMAWADSDGHAHHHDDGGHHALKDLNGREIVTLLFLTVFVFWIGLHPAPLLKVMDASVTHLVDQVNAGMQHLPPMEHHEHHAWLMQVGSLLKKLVVF